MNDTLPPFDETQSDFTPRELASRLMKKALEILDDDGGEIIAAAKLQEALDSLKGQASRID